jgi:N-acetylmuramoyl-L-alanine amidase
MRQKVRPKAATVRPILRVVLATALALSMYARSGRAEETSSSRRDTAKAQFERAEKARHALEARPESARTLKDYTALVVEYQRVYLTTPHGTEVPAALNEVAELFRTMADLFDAKYYQRSIDSYQFLLKEYPASKYREDALLAIAQIEQEDLHDAVLAQKSYQQFLSLHPRSSHAAEVRAILDKLNAENSGSKPASTPVASKNHADHPGPTAASAEKTPPATDTNSGSSSGSFSGSSADNSDAGDSASKVSRIRTWNADTYTRVVIDVGSKVKYQAARISGPDRIYFDIEGAHVSSVLLHRAVEVESGGFLKSVRVAQNQAGVVRVVLEVNRVSDYSVFLLPDPYRLVVDVYGNSAAAETAARNTAPAPGPTTTDQPPAKSEKPAKEEAANGSAKLPAPARPTDRAAAKSTVAPLASGSATPAPTPPAAVADSAAAAPDSDSATPKTPGKPAKSSRKANLSASAKTATGPDSESSAGSATSAVSTDEAAAASPPATIETAKKPGRQAAKSAHEQAEELGPPPTPELTRNGQHSLTRALGLKIGRIVIDPGHGGHDTGTIGPTGLMEKDLSLDVALRLGKIIQQKLPGADVVFTRDDDTFIPLERRTEIANESKADLFISIHANSSQDRQARGVETYYLNFTASSDAMEVASRENALSENGVHDLQNIVAKIARNEKIEESRDLAAMLQDSLSKRMETANRGDRNRGVRKAPFVVLIGADMPSVLAEVSFLSNPSDEKWLKNPENRQRVAEGLYRGVENYLQSTNSLTSNQARSAAENFAGKVARSGNSQ